jgi:hypothetical protein
VILETVHPHLQRRFVRGVQSLHGACIEVTPEAPIGIVRHRNMRCGARVLSGRQDVRTIARSAAERIHLPPRSRIGRTAATLLGRERPCDMRRRVVVALLFRHFRQFRSGLAVCPDVVLVLPFQCRFDVILSLRCGVFFGIQKASFAIGELTHIDHDLGIGIGFAPDRADIPIPDRRGDFYGSDWHDPLLLICRYCWMCEKPHVLHSKLSDLLLDLRPRTARSACAVPDPAPRPAASARCPTPRHISARLLRWACCRGPCPPAPRARRDRSCRGR